MNRIRALAWAVVRRPHPRAILIRRALYSTLLAVLWLVAGLSRLAEDGRVLAGLLLLGAVFFTVRAAAYGIVVGSTPHDEDVSKRSGNVDDS